MDTKPEDLPPENPERAQTEEERIMEEEFLRELEDMECSQVMTQEEFFSMLYHAAKEHNERCPPRIP